MKRQVSQGLVAGMMMAVGMTAWGATSTIDPAHTQTYGANIGWVDARADFTNGAVVGLYFCSGCLYGANVGWISLGDGAPANGWEYGNKTADDYGVNHDGQGHLRGYAWGANIGWIVFEPAGDPRVDLNTGVLSGYAWGANVGWIALSNAQAYVRTTRLDTGVDVDQDGLPDAWEWKISSSTRILSGGAHDEDKDGATDEEEFRADTNPQDDTDQLKMLSLTAVEDANTVAWTARPTRLYRLEATNTLAGAGAWPDAGPGLLGPPSMLVMTQTVSGVTASSQFYRVQAVVPLSN